MHYVLKLHRIVQQYSILTTVQCYICICFWLLLRFSKRGCNEFFWILDSSILVVFLIFKTEKTEENFLSEGVTILISPLNKDMDSPYIVATVKRAGEISQRGNWQCSVDEYCVVFFVFVTGKLVFLGCCCCLNSKMEIWARALGYLNQVFLILHSCSPASSYQT